MPPQKPLLARNWRYTPENLQTIDRLSRRSAAERMMKNKRFIRGTVLPKGVDRDRALRRGFEQFYQNYLLRIHHAVLKATLDEQEIRDPKLRVRIFAALDRTVTPFSHATPEDPAASLGLFKVALEDIFTMPNSRHFVERYRAILGEFQKRMANKTVLAKEFNVTITELKRK